MLKSQDTNTEPQTPSLGKARVTPQELSQALAAIETRKQAEASRLAETIPLEDAVSELHLDSTPEEIWAEVQAQREKQTAVQNQSFAEADAARREQLRQVQANTPPRPQSLRVTPLRIQLPGLMQPSSRQRFWLRPFIPLLVVGAMFGTGVLPHFWSHLTASSVSVTRPLAQIPAGQEVFADNTALAQLSEGKPLTQITVNENQSDNRWTLVKMGSHVYLRGYIANTDSLQTLRGQALNVFNDDNSGELNHVKTSNITLRVDNVPLQKSGGDDDFSEVTVPNFQPDPMTALNPGR